MGYREQEHSTEPMWGIQKFPISLHRALKMEAAHSGRTMTEVLVDELEVIADRLNREPGSSSPDVEAPGDLMPFFTVKHFPRALRVRLKELAALEEVHLYQFVIRELWASMGVKA